LHVPLPRREAGNAALSYYRAIALLPNQSNDTNWDRIIGLLGTNMATLRSSSIDIAKPVALHQLVQ
jgi:hypothetical protein